MSGIAVAFVFVCALALVVVPRHWAMVPLVLGACYMPLEQGVEIGPFNFTVIRILVAVGVVRAALRAERLSGGICGLDWLMAGWAAWACASSIFHRDPTSALVFRLGLVYNAGGIYLLFRVFCSSVHDAILLCRATAWLLVPIALEMIQEQFTSQNIFSVLGASVPPIREGRLRAIGPFSHPILAGTVGATSLPMIAAIWHSHRAIAIVGALACVAIVLASASSGPLMSAFAAVGALAMWRFRRRIGVLRWLAVASYLALDLFMEAPAYYLFSRIDLVGGSTGWHRARLMQSAFEHLDEWWFSGTDYTRHWMDVGVGWSTEHTDITNYYLHMGVLGGLPLMVLLILILAVAFAYVGRTIREGETMTPPQSGFVVWCLGAAMFSHCVTSFSVAYFDQSFLFFFLIPATVASLRTASPRAIASSSAASTRESFIPLVDRRGGPRRRPFMPSPPTRRSAVRTR